MTVPEITDIAVIPSEAIQATFSTPGALRPLLAKIAERARSFVADVSTLDGRRDIASLALKISKAKTSLDGIGKDLVDGLKEMPKKVDAGRKECRDFLDALRDEIRKPLTEWEEEEKRQVALQAAQIEAERLRKEIELLHELAILQNAEFDRQREEARKAKEIAQREREERIAKEAAEKAQREEREAAARREAVARAAQERAERERLEAEERARLAEEREKRAVEQERLRREEEEKRIAAEQAKREANAKHRKKIISAIEEDLSLLGIEKKLAQRIAFALAEGKVRNVEVKF